MTELEKAHRLIGDMLKAQHEQEKRLVTLQEENRKLVADYGARGDLLAEAREMFDLHVVWASDQVAIMERQVDALGEALYLMSGPLKASGFLDNDENHRLYENVVAAYREIGWADDAPTALTSRGEK